MCVSGGRKVGWFLADLSVAGILNFFVDCKRIHKLRRKTGIPNILTQNKNWEYDIFCITFCLASVIHVQGGPSKSNCWMSSKYGSDYFRGIMPYIYIYITHLIKYVYFIKLFLGQSSCSCVQQSSQARSIMGPDYTWPLYSASIYPCLIWYILDWDRDKFILATKIERTVTSLQWRHYERDGVSNHLRLHCLRNCRSRRRSKNTSKLRVTGLCAGNSPVTGEFPAQKAGYAGNVSIWWRHNVLMEGYKADRHIWTSVLNVLFRLLNTS